MDHGTAIKSERIVGPPGHAPVVIKWYEDGAISIAVNQKHAEVEQLHLRDKPVRIVLVPRRSD